jgi:hypothetical protein
MNRRLPEIDIAPDLTIRIGRESARVTPTLALALARSLAHVAGREMVRQAAEQAQRIPSTNFPSPLHQARKPSRSRL